MHQIGDMRMGHVMRMGGQCHYVYDDYTLMQIAMAIMVQLECDLDH